MIIDEIKRDLQSFADDESDVVYLADGTFLVVRQGKDIQFRVIVDEETNGVVVVYRGKEIPYRSFIAYEIAKLDIFATKLIEKRSSPKHFVNSSATYKSIAEEEAGPSLEVLSACCRKRLFATKIIFITADAGHGKTALLREFQYRQAESFLKRESNYLVWHVDLQGRSLVRLNEALMYDLGELRVSGHGLYHASIITLIRMGLVVLAIDGFDELAAEIGGSAALGSLSYLVNQLEDRGTVLAASRRTFFSTQDYLKRTNFLKSSISPRCEFQELKLENWTKSDTLKYIKLKFPALDELIIYNEILSEANGNIYHPILTRPFLLTKTIDLVDILSLQGYVLKENLESDSPAEGIAAVVEQFTKREVTKWKLRDSETGKPYLSYDQHMTFLELVSENMWQSQVDTISVESVEFYATELCEEWAIDDSIRSRVVKMASSHALLVPVDGDDSQRKFEHEEFKNYFVARSLAARMSNATRFTEKRAALKMFLQLSQLPESMAQYACWYTKKNNVSIVEHISMLSDIVATEWKPTYLQTNIGTIIPFILDDEDLSDKITISAKVNYTSLCFENKIIKNTSFQDASFINISFKHSRFSNVDFKNCLFNELRIHADSNNGINKCVIEQCEISALAVYSSDGFLAFTLYNPEKINEYLRSFGFTVIDESVMQSPETKNAELSEFKKGLLKFLNVYHRASVQFESNIINDSTSYKKYKNILLSEIVPFLLDQNIIGQTEKTKSTKQVLHRAWSLKVDLEELLKADGLNESGPYSDFWNKVNNRKI